MGPRLGGGWVIWAVLFGWAMAAEAGYRGPFEGRVVDAETLQPIQGAVVLVEWLKGTPTPAGRVDAFYAAAEVVTDENGYFRIEKKSSWNPWTNWMMNSNVIIFRAGYRAFETFGWRRLAEIVEIQREHSEKVGQRLPAEIDVKIEEEDGHYLFVLRRLSTTEARRENLRVGPIFTPPQEMVLLVAEKNRERSLLGTELHPTVNTRK